MPKINEPPARKMLGYFSHLESLLVWLVAYPVFPLQLLLFWLISWGGFGKGLGLDDLLWNDAPGSQFLGGIFVGLLFGEILFLRYLLDRDRDLLPVLPWSLFGNSDPTVRALGRFMLLFWPVTLAILLLPKWALSEFRQNETPYWPMFAGTSLGVALTAAVVAIGEWSGIRKWIQDSRLLRNLPGLGPKTPAAERPLHALATMMVAVAAMALTPVAVFWHSGRTWSPVVAACLILGVFSSVIGFVQFHLRGMQYVLLIACIGWIYVANNDPYKSTLPGLEEHYKAHAEDHLRLDVVKWQGKVYDFYHEGILNHPDHSAAKAELIESEEPLRKMCAAWQEVHGKNSKPRLVFIATSGGGIRAAVWTAVVLEGLQREMPGDAARKKPALVDHIRMFTGASGGMVGAAHFVADYENRHDPKRPRHSEELARDSLAPTMQTMLFNDLPSLGLLGRRGYDRGRALEDAWYDNTRRPDGRSPMERSFKELHGLEKEGKCPSLVFSPMMVEDARRLLISNLDLNDLTEAYCARLMPDEVEEETRLLSLSAVELRRLFPSAIGMKVGTAARVNATFPFVSPGVSLPTYPARRIVDAGYYDNYGVNLAAVWAYQHRLALRDYTSGVVLIEIRAYRNGFARRHFQDALDEQKRPSGPVETDPDAKITDQQRQMVQSAPTQRQKVSSVPRLAVPPRPRRGSWLGPSSLWFVTTPFESLVDNWSHGTLYRDDEFLNLVGALLNPPGEAPLFTTVALECGADAALNWHLPAYEAKNIRGFFFEVDDGNQRKMHAQVEQQVKKLKEWFGDGGEEARRPLPKGKR